jgi:hypothetical protein
VAICAPATSCCCDDWTISPGLTLPLFIDWSVWLASLPGYKLNAIAKVTLCKVANPIVAAPDYEIALVSGREPPPATGNPGWTEILNNGTVTLNIIKAGDDVAIGNLYRLDLTVNARDCDSRVLVLKYCVSIYIVSC